MKIYKITDAKTFKQRIEHRIYEMPDEQLVNEAKTRFAFIEPDRVPPRGLIERTATSLIKHYAEEAESIAIERAMSASSDEEEQKWLLIAATISAH